MKTEQRRTMTYTEPGPESLAPEFGCKDPDHHSDEPRIHVPGMSTPPDQRSMKIEIRYVVVECSLGCILVAGNAEGTLAISLGDDPELLARELQQRYPRSALSGGDPGNKKRAVLVADYVEQPAGRLDLPLHIRGTAFQQQVWHALMQIPAGNTVSYGALARHIGRPGASRAVAAACAANTLAVAIPCHRVIRSDGALSGYRWGVDRKRILLNREATLANTGNRIEARHSPRTQWMQMTA